MLVRDIMTTNVITVSSDTLMVEAGKTMEFHKIERLPVVDRGKLVGIVTKSTLDKSGPSQATSLTRWELNYLLSQIKVKEIMRKDVVTIPYDATAECAIATAQRARVGSLPVLEEGRLAGIVTTNDFFYRILNPLMGIGGEGTRIAVHKAGGAEQMQKVMGCISKAGVRIKAMCTVQSSDAKGNDLLIHLDTEDARDIIVELMALGFMAETRDYKPC